MVVQQIPPFPLDAINEDVLETLFTPLPTVECGVGILAYVIDMQTLAERMLGDLPGEFTRQYATALAREAFFFLYIP